jgi:hypothetical protein
MLSGVPDAGLRRIDTVQFEATIGKLGDQTPVAAPKVQDAAARMQRAKEFGDGWPQIRMGVVRAGVREGVLRITCRRQNGILFGANDDRLALDRLFLIAI